ncbi:MAG: hypothetical protein V4727_05215 [Verrucomicrobiota bacterium]
MNRQTIVRISIAALILMVVATGVYQALNWNNPARKFRRAIEVEHAHYSSDEFGDYTHLIKGRIMDIPIEDLAKILELPSHTTKSIREFAPDAHGWRQFPEHKWWILPKEFDEIYYDLDAGSQCILGRRGNTIFLQDITW